MVESDDLYVVDEIEGGRLREYDGVDNNGVGVFKHVGVIEV